MSVRGWKAIFVAIFSFIILAYAVQNVFNITGGMHYSFQYVLGQADHTAYPNSFVPAIDNNILIWHAFILGLVGKQD